MTEKNTPLSERESKNLIPKIVVCMPDSEVYEYIDLFITKLYNKGYRVCKKIDKKVKP